VQPQVAIVFTIVSACRADVGNLQAIPDDRTRPALRGRNFLDERREVPRSFSAYEVTTSSDPRRPVMSTSSKPATPPLPERLLTIAEVADALGVEVRHVRRLVHERRIPYIKWGHLLRFDPIEIAAWVDRARHPASR